MLKLDHFAFEVSNMDDALAFYQEKLGLKLLSRNINEEHHEEYAFLELDAGTLELITVTNRPKEPAPPIRPPYCPHLAFKTDDMDETIKMVIRNKRSSLMVIL